jgi:hypothetical protein
MAFELMWLVSLVILGSDLRFEVQVHKTDEFSCLRTGLGRFKNSMSRILVSQGILVVRLDQVGSTAREILHSGPVPDTISLLNSALALLIKTQSLLFGRYFDNS